MTQFLETKRLVLSPIEERDLTLLAEWRGTKDYLEFVSSRENKNYHLQFMICLKKDHEPIGVVYTFSYNKPDGFLFLNVFLKEGRRKNGYGAESCTIAICYIFDHFPVYKIYCDALSSNTQSISMMRGIGLEQEGFLRGHRLYKGVRHDILRFAVQHENLGRIKGLLQKLQSR